MNKFKFFVNFLKDPHIAAVFPSSRFVSRKVLNLIPFYKVKTIIEYGPGTGAITKEILKKLGKDGKLIAVERNEKFYQVLEKINDPRFYLFHDDAKNIETHLKKLNIQKADVVLSAIPISYLNQDQKNELLQKTKTILSTEGKFIIYSQHTFHARSLLKKFLGNARLHIELRNIPPALIFEATKKE